MIDITAEWITDIFALGVPGYGLSDETAFSRLPPCPVSEQVRYPAFGDFEARDGRLDGPNLPSAHPGFHLHGFDSFEGLPED